MTIIDIGGLPYEITFVIGTYYIFTTKIDVADDLADGAVGKLFVIDQDDEITKGWLIFLTKVGRKRKKKVNDIMQ